MEHWRSFFNKAGEDLWTIIEQAILLAAHDYPREFKEKRCEIAETLFARSPHQGDVDATRLSASVVTNCTNRMDVDETRGENEHVSVHTKAHTRHDAEQHHTELCSAEARNDGVDDHASISQVVCNIKEALDDSLQVSHSSSCKALCFLPSSVFSFQYVCLCSRCAKKIKWITETLALQHPIPYLFCTRPGRIILSL